LKVSGCGLYEIRIGENNDPSVGHPVAFCPYRVHALSRRCFCRGCSPASSTNELHQLDCGTSGIPGAPVLGGSGPGPRSSARPGTSGGLGPTPASTPPLDGMWDTYHTVTDAADTYLDSFVRSLTWTTGRLQTHQKWEGEHLDESIGTKLLRNIYHYWFHTGEAHAIRQLLGHTDLPEFVGDISRAVYHPEA
jgi:hypothetical protein